MTLMTDYKTPGRQPLSVAAAADANVGNSGRRVVRSALELLAETASPEPVKEQTSTASAPAPSKFTVVRAAAPPPSPGITAPLQEQREQRQQWTSSFLDDDVGAVTTVATEEPSTLLFLSPMPAVKGGNSAVKKRLFKKKKTVKLSDSAKKAVTATIAGKEFRQLAETPVKSKGRVEEGKREASAAFIRCENSSHDQNELLSRREPLFTEEEVQQRIAEALKTYEARRDAEEESVLQEVGNEIELQNIRYEKLLEEKHIAEEEQNASQAKMEQLALQCEMLQTTIAELHHELQEEREKVSRVEVQLCHAQDEKRLTSCGMQQELNFEKAQWKLAQEEMQRQINEFEAQLKTRTIEWHELQKATREKETEWAQLSSQLETCQTELKKWQQRHSEVESARAEQSELIAAKETLIRQLQHKLQEAERALKRAATSTRDEETQLESRLRSVEEALRQQTDEVRRKMHRVHVLEAEQAKVEQVNKSLRRALHEAASRFFDIHSTLETFVELFRTNHHVRPSQSGVRDAPFSPAMGVVDHRDVQNLLAGNSDTSSAVTEEEEEEGEGDSSLLDLITCKELRDNVRQGCLFGGKKGPVLQQQRRLNVQRRRGDKHSVNTKKGMSADVNEVDVCNRLLRCYRQCEHLLETLRRLLFGRHKQLQRQLYHMEKKRVEESKAELARLQEALVVCQASLEESRQQEKLLKEECRQRCEEAQWLGNKLSELRAAEQDAMVQQKQLMERVDELQRERGILRLQLEASQQDCVELRERYESICLELEGVQDRLRLLENSHRLQEEAMEVKTKIQVRLNRCTDKLKKTEGECQALRDENEALSNKMKSMLLQLQTSRMRQNSMNTASLAQKHVEQKQQREELTALTKELGALRGLQESAAAQHAKERAEAESSLEKLRKRNEELRDELTQEQRALNDARSQLDVQRRSEAVMLRALMGIYGIGSETSTDAVEGSDKDGVRQRLFDSSPMSLAENGMTASHWEMETADLRGRVVSVAQRTVLELARLKEALSQAQRTEAETKLDIFRATEQLAKEAAQRSAARRQLCVDDGEDAVTPALPSHRATPLLTGATSQPLCHSLGTPGRRSMTRKSPSPKQIGGETIPPGLFPRRRSVSSVTADAAKDAGEKGRGFASNGVFSSLRTSTGGISRSRSAQGVLDGSCSPARPPMLWAPSVR